MGLTPLGIAYRGQCFHSLEALPSPLLVWAEHFRSKWGLRELSHGSCRLLWETLGGFEGGLLLSSRCLRLSCGTGKLGAWIWWRLVLMGADSAMAWLWLHWSKYPLLRKLPWIAILVWIWSWILAKFWLLLLSKIRSRYIWAYFEELWFGLNLIIQVCISVLDKATHVLLCYLMVFWYFFAAGLGSSHMLIETIFLVLSA